MTSTSAAAPHTGVGRSCPLSYRHGAEALREAPTLDADVAWIAGGLYGNVEAARALVAEVERDRAAGLDARLVLNGDYHWFDVDPDDFLAIEELLQPHVRLAGNVEAELGSPSAGAGCGCAYPAWVDEATVVRSNAIMERLQGTVARLDGLAAGFAALPRVLRVRSAGRTVGVVHGDPDALAGWGLAVERLAANGGPTDGPQLRHWADAAEVDAFACAHTCLPWMGAPGGIPVANNGSAGMPNFRGRLAGLATRIGPAEAASGQAVYGLELQGLCFEAVEIRFDPRAWWARFEQSWPPGSPAQESYAARIRGGPAFELAQARPGATPGARGCISRRPPPDISSRCSTSMS